MSRGGSPLSSHATSASIEIDRMALSTRPARTRFTDGEDASPTRRHDDHDSRSPPVDRRGVSRIRGSRWPGTLGFGLALAAAPALLAASGALWVQVAAAGGGAVAATGGVWLMRFGWPNRRHSELHNLLMALG